MNEWQAIATAIGALTPAAMKLLSGDEKAALILTKKVAAKQAGKAIADSKKARLRK